MTNKTPFPYRWKYLSERQIHRSWFIFGIHPETKRVSISDGQEDIFEDVEPEVAEKILQIRKEYLDKLETLNDETLQSMV